MLSLKAEQRNPGVGGEITDRLHARGGSVLKVPSIVVTSRGPARRKASRFSGGFPSSISCLYPIPPAARAWARAVFENPFLRDTALRRTSTTSSTRCRCIARTKSSIDRPSYPAETIVPVRTAVGLTVSMVGRSPSFLSGAQSCETKVGFGANTRSSGLVVPGVGVEPTCPLGQPVLSGPRLPVAPPGHVVTVARGPSTASPC